MADLEGNKTGGRAAGTINKKNQEIQDLAKELGCNPAKILMLIAMGDRVGLSTKYKDEDGNEKTQEWFVDLDQRKDAAKDLMPYLYGKRKPVDSNGDDKSDPLAEILDAINGTK
jgi:hypothetical protein